MSLLALLLCLTMVLWGGLAVDVNFLGIHVVAEYATFMAPTVFWFSVNALLSFILAKQGKSLGPWTQTTHILLSFITAAIYIYQIWGVPILLSGLARRYYSVGADGPSNESVLLLNGLVFLTSQLVFIATFAAKMMKR